MSRKTELPTYVFIDASNIKHACAESCGKFLDFKKLMGYLRHKYPRLQEVLYYEGIAKDDAKRQRYFNFLKHSGYRVCTLVRKTYSVNPIVKAVTCEKCGHEQVTTILPARPKMKSNVDVYLATDMMERAIDLGGTAAHFILMSCDGDYRETIEALLSRYPQLHLSVLATPFRKPDEGVNFLSSRLRYPASKFPERYELMNIETIIGLIS